MELESFQIYEENNAREAFQRAVSHPSSYRVHKTENPHYHKFAISYFSTSLLLLLFIHTRSVTDVGRPIQGD